MILALEGRKTPRDVANARSSFARNSEHDADSPFDSLYRGMGPPLVGVTPIFAISFWVRLASDLRDGINASISPF